MPAGLSDEALANRRILLRPSAHKAGGFCLPLIGTLPQTQGHLILENIGCSCPVSHLCKAIASAIDPESHMSQSSGLIKSTGMALTWIGRTMSRLTKPVDPLVDLAAAYESQVRAIDDDEPDDDEPVAIEEAADREGEA